MRHLKLLGGFFALLLLTVGCSPLHTEVKGGYRWEDVAVVGLEASGDDRWGLTPVVREQLQATGYAVVPAGDAGQQLLVRFSTKEGPDFTSDGVLVTRPKSLHVQFVDPGRQSLVAVADYFLRSSEDPAAGMREALAGVQQKIRDAARGVPTWSAPAPGPDRPAATQAAVPSTASAPSPQVEAQVPAVAPDLPPAAEAAEAASTASGSNMPEGVAPVVESEQEIRSLKESPWVPRFKSWGFDEWGKGGKTEP